MVVEGCIQKARQACEQQVEEMLNKMHDPACRKLYLIGYEVKQNPKVSNGRSKRPVNASFHHKQEARSMSADTAMESRQNCRVESASQGKSEVLNACNQQSTHEADSVDVLQNGNSQSKQSIDCSQGTSKPPPSGKKLVPKNVTLQDLEIPSAPLTIPRENDVNSSQDKKQSKRKKKAKQGLAQHKNPNVPNQRTKDHVGMRFK